MAGGFRTYRFEVEDPISGGPVRITAIVYPPVVVVERSFCPSEPDKCGGCEWEDITKLGPDTPWVVPSRRAKWLAWLRQVELAFSLSKTEEDIMDDIQTARCEGDVLPPSRVG